MKYQNNSNSNKGIMIGFMIINHNRYNTNNISDNSDNKFVNNDNAGNDNR